MPSEVVTLDPTSEDAANAQVLLEDRANGIKLVRHEYPDPEPEYQGVESADTEGSRYVQNRLRDRTITAVVRCYGSSNMRARVSDLQEKIGKLNREQGTYKRTLADATTIVFDVKSASIQVPADWQFLHKDEVEVTMTFLCAPLGRGAEQTLTDHAETTLPVCIGVDTAVLGDYPALGRLVIDNDAAADQWHVVWGMQSRHYDSATTAKLFYEAEELAAHGGGAIIAGPTGASGGTVVRNTSLTTSFQSVMSGKIGGATWMTHVGAFEVWARVQTPATNAGTVTVALEWGQGDFRTFTQNDPVTIEAEWEATWRRVPLGLVHLPEPVSGAQRWEPRILAKSTAPGDDIDIDYVFLVPVTEGSGEASAIQQFQTPTSLSARDEFDQAAGALNAKTAALGGAWATSGVATDFATTGAGALTRSTTVDSPGGRLAVLGATTYTACGMQVDCMASAAGVASPGLLARHVDASNYADVVIDNSAILRLEKVIAGARATVAAERLAVPLAADTFYTVRLVVDPAGRFWVWVGLAGTPIGFPVLEGQDSALATGGTLASGKAGLRDLNETDTLVTRTYDNFVVSVPAADAAIFASQSLEVRHDAVIREDSGGSVWARVSRYEGDYARPLPAGLEARSLRTIVAVHRNDPETMPDSTIDDVSFRWYVTPRYLHVPAP